MLAFDSRDCDACQLAPYPSNTVADLLSPLPQAIRKKIESELSRKRPTPKPRSGGGAGGGSSSRHQPKPKQGTVSALRPLPALTVPHSISVADASQLCAAKRTDCVLVVDEEEHLCGIFTAKDLAPAPDRKSVV